MALRYYEGMFLFDSTEAAKDMPAVLAHVDTLLKKHGAVVLKNDRWDDRKLAYDLGNVKRGTYVLTMFQAEPTVLPAVLRDCELSELILRQLFLEDEDLLARVKEREELKKKREAEAAQAAAEGLPIEGDRDRRYGGDRPRFSRDREGPRRERVPVPVEEIEVPEDLNA